MNRKQIVAVLAILALTLGALPAFAGDPDSAGNPGTKLARGIVNASTGWVEIPKETARGAEEAGLPGLIGGLLKGVTLGVVRTAVGGYEIGTFFLPIPDGYEPVLQPPTAFDGR